MGYECSVRRVFLFSCISYPQYPWGGNGKRRVDESICTGKRKKKTRVDVGTDTLPSFLFPVLGAVSTLKREGMGNDALMRVHVREKEGEKGRG